MASDKLANHSSGDFVISVLRHPFQADNYLSLSHISSKNKSYRYSEEKARVA